MKLLLISPGGVMYRRRGGIFPITLRNAPLTLTTLAALVPPELNAQIEIVDEGVRDCRPDIEADLVAISAITGTASRAYAIADHYRARGATVVLGGVHPTLVPDEAALHADAVVTGLAFETWPQLLRDFQEGRMRPLYAQDGPPNLARLPHPRRDLYSRFDFLLRNTMQVTFSCPYRCDFCAVVATQPFYTRRPIDDVLAELDALPGRNVVFLDPSPMEDRDYALAWFRGMRGLGKRWGGLSTVRAAADDELMDAAAESGCRGLLLGFESVDTAALRSVSKGFNQTRQYREVVRKLHQRGIAINGTFFFGADADGPDCFRRTVDFVMETGIDLPRYAIYTPFPGTRVWERLEREGRIATRNWALYDGQHVVHSPKLLTPEQLREGLLAAWEETYSLRAIAHRLATARRGLSLFGWAANLGYRYYAYRLRRFNGDALLAAEAEWNAPFVDGYHMSEDVGLPVVQEAVS